MSLPAELVIEKNKLNAKFPWLALVKFAINEGDSDEIVHRFVRNHPDVTFRGDVYKGFSFDLGVVQERLDGRIHQTTLSVSGVSLELQAELEALGGALNAEITLTIVHADNLASDYAELEFVFDILSTHIGPQSINFAIGAPSLLFQRFLTQRYFADFCSYETFEGVRCGHVWSSGEPEFCHRRLSDCREYGNSNRFGGAPGLRRDGIHFL